MDPASEAVNDRLSLVLQVRALILKDKTSDLHIPLITRSVVSVKAFISIEEEVRLVTSY